MKKLLHIWLLVVVFVVGFCACAPVRSVQGSQAAESFFAKEATDSAKLSACVEQHLRAFFRKNTERLLQQDVTIDRVVLSVPDSLGRQYPMQTEKVCITIHLDENESHNDSTTIATHGCSEETTVSQMSSQHQAVSEVSVKEHAGLRHWQRWLIVIGILAIVVAIIKIRRKWKLL